MPAPQTESLLATFDEALGHLAEKFPGASLLEAENASAAVTPRFCARFPERCIPFDPTQPSMLGASLARAGSSRPLFAVGPAVLLAEREFHTVRTEICLPRRNVKLVATQSGLAAGPAGPEAQTLEDVALMRGLPSMTVVVPADAATTRSATGVLAALDGPAYLRLDAEPRANVSDGSFELGRAPELRAGSDLALVAVGALVARALEVADELHRVGVEARVLDFASVKPFDEKALLRAARDTGALLTMEDQLSTTGIGGIVAAATAENYPVPVRRLGVPDLFGEAGPPATLLDRYGLSKERALEEAWELLRLKGKVQ